MKLRRLACTSVSMVMTGIAAGALAAQNIDSDSLSSAPKLAETAFRIRAQPLNAALKEFALQARLQLLYETDKIDSTLPAPPVDGIFTPDAALARMLAHTNLIYRFVNDATVTIREASSGEPASLADSHLTATAMTTTSDEATNSSTTDTETQANSRPKELAEVLVTAEKRPERLQDVPVPVSTVDTGALIDNNQLRIQDYYTEVPGLSASLNNSGAANLSIRGITAGDGVSPTVGIVIDDVPYGSSTILGSGAAVPDIDPSELSRIEVLRGPQGTLYGASSIGGLVKFVTVDPSTDGVSGQIQGGINGVHAGNEAGYGLRGAINVPLSDVVAVRASAFTRRDPGYIDNIQTNEEGVNRGDADGARLTALWRPSDDLKLKLSALLQDNRTYGSPNVMVGPGFGELQQATLRGSNGYSNKIEAYSAIVAGSLGGGFEFTSSTGFSVNRTFLPQDLTPFFGDFTQDQFGVGGTLTLFEADTRKLSEEFRINKSFGPWIDWLFGGFYTHENSEVDSPIVAVSTTDGAEAGTWLNSSAPSTFTEYAAFTDLTFHLTRQLDLQLGGRESYNDQSYYQLQTGPYVSMFLAEISPFAEGPIRTHENAFNYLVTPSFKLTPDTMVYGRLASGYRPGGPNVGGAIFHAPLSFAADKTQNYEIGVKSEVLSHRVTLDASVYRIDWKNIQTLGSDPNTGATYEVNGSRARSQGVELSTQARPAWEGLTIAAWESWNKAELTEPFPVASTVHGLAADRLPYAARFSGRMSVQQDFPVVGSLTGSVAGAVSYVGNRIGEFSSAFGPFDRQTYGAYAQTDLRAGLKNDELSLNLYCNNVTDRRGQLNGGLNFFPSNAFNYIQPRTVGLVFTKKFGTQR